MNTTTSSNRTNFESIQLLCQSILRRLETQRMIAIIKEERQVLTEAMAKFLAPYVLTQEDMENEVLNSIGSKNEELTELNLSGGEAYRTVRQRWLAKHGEHEVDGLFFQKPIKYIAEGVIQFLFKHNSVDEVFSEDEKLLKTIVHTIGSFRRSKLH